jgi:ketosteroid isomerase-like protein
MKKRLYYIALTAIAVTLIAGCAIKPVSKERLSKVAVITSGDTNIRALTKFGRLITVVAIDGAPNDKPYGPIELDPGTHSVTMKCGDATNTNTLTVLPGEVYQFSMVTTPEVKGCSATLSRVQEASPEVRQEAAERAKAETARKERLAQAERAKAEEFARAARAKAEAARAQAPRAERAGPGSVPTSDQLEVADAIARWADAWSRKDVAAYLAAYAKNFAVPGGRSRKQWEAQRRARIVGKRSIEVKIDDLQVSIDGNTAQARFRQSYRAGRLAETGNKMLTLERTNAGWLIQQER